MKSKLFFFTSVCLASLTFAWSCQKEDAETPRWKQDESFTCQHDSLFFVPGVEPTDVECGCVDHYYCPQCGKCFSDGTCQLEIESPILWGTSLVLNAGEYFDFFETAFNEFGYMDEIASSKCELACLPSIKDLLVDNADDIIDNVFEFFDKEPDKTLIIKEGLKSISDNLLKVERAILGLAEMHKEEAIKKSINDRERKLFYLRNATHPCFMSVLNQISASKITSKKWSDLPAERVNNIKGIVDEWYSTGVYNGITYEDCYITVSELLHFFNGFWTSVKSFPELYDQLAFKSTPWLHQANITRMMCRCSDIMTLTEAYTVMCLYYHFHPDNISQERIRLFNIEMKKYDSVLEAHPADTEVVAHTRWIWKNKASNEDLTPFKLHRDIWHFKNKASDKEDLIDQSLNELMVSRKPSWYEEDLGAIAKVYNASLGPDNDKHNSISIGEQRIIYNYYREKGMTDYYEMLIKAGFRNVTRYNENGRLVYWVNDVHRFGNNGEAGEYHGLSYQCQVLYDGVEYKGKIYFRRQLSPDCKSIEDVSSIREGVMWEMEINEYYKPLYMKTLGTRTKYNFESLTRTDGMYAPIIY